jgi:hypothetical protein
MTITRKAANASDFLKLVPRMLGYVPERSLVVIPFNGSRSVGAMRFDLPPADSLVSSVASIMGVALQIREVTAFVPIVYTDETALEGIGLPLIHEFNERAHQAGIHLSDKLIVANDGYVSAFDPTLEVKPLSDLVLDDDPDLPSIKAGGVLAGTELPAVELGDFEDVQAALAGLAVTIEVLTTGESTSEFDPANVEAILTVAMLDDLPELYEQALTWVPKDIPAYSTAALAWCFARPALRDVALVQWCNGRDAGDRALEAQMAWEEGVEYPADLAMQMWGEGPQPNPERLERALKLMRHVASYTTNEVQAGALATAAWLSWALGRSSHAEHYAKQAIIADPEHGLAEIVHSFVTAGHLPAWAFIRPAS